MAFNGFMLGLLRSPLHGALSGSMMVLTFTGRRSGRRYTTPVNYTRETMDDGSERLWVLSARERQWWRNLRGDQPVALEMKRRPIAAIGHLIEQPAEVEKALAHVLALSPSTARLLKAPMHDGVFDIHALRQAAE